MTYLGIIVEEFKGIKECFEELCNNCQEFECIDKDRCLRKAAMNYFDRSRDNDFTAD